MSLPFSPLLDPQVLAAVRDLRLEIGAKVEGALAGLHLDARSGPGVEFSQFRPYAPGDEPQRVDWRAYARSDRYLVRESEEERERTVRFLLDVSGSMAHAGDGVGKLDVARSMVAVLAWVASRQGDHVRLEPVSDLFETDRAGGRRPETLAGLLQALEQLEPGGVWPSPEALLAGRRRRRGRELVVVVSDLHQLRGEISGAVDLLRALGDQVLVLHLLARDELTFDYQGDLVFVDLESGREVRGRGEELRAGWLERLEAELATWRRQLAGAGVRYELIETDRPLVESLRRILTSGRAGR